MAKSIRSKRKRAFRAIKRQNVFKHVEDARLTRLAQKIGSLDTNDENQSERMEMEGEGEVKKENNIDDVQGNNATMEIDEGKSSVSTGGVRASRNARKKMQILATRRKAFGTGSTRNQVRKFRRK